ncbi:MAG: GNAT family N-acetyltransferase [Clostridiales bacterium]|nr:GNAT family N-acetyltransferase [Clostridiales bacterium]
MSVILRRVNNEKDLIYLAELADEIWHQHFITILSEDQIDYMVEKFQSFAAMKNQMLNQGYEYYFIVADGETVGYTGIKNDVDKLFLSKLYIKKAFRGKHYASAVFEQLKEICRQRNLKAIWLTVNRFNDQTIAVYQKKGFQTIRTQVTDIGEGYVMDDYVMEMEI